MPRLKAFLDRLHATPLGEFVRVRKELAAELRARGDSESAAELGAVKKPPITAWALNQVALKEPAAVTAVAHATEKLAAAQRRALAAGGGGGGGGAEAFREASRELHARIAAVVGKARAALREAGKSPNVAQLRRVQRSLQALPFAAPEDVERLSRGHLEADLDAPSAFDLLGAGAGAAAPPARATHATKEPRERAREGARAQAAARRRERAEKAGERRDEARRARERARAEKQAATLERRARELEKQAASLAASAEAAARRARDARRAADDAARAASPR